MPKEQYLPVNLVSDWLQDQGNWMKRDRLFLSLYRIHMNTHILNQPHFWHFIFAFNVSVLTKIKDCSIQKSKTRMDKVCLGQFYGYLCVCVSAFPMPCDVCLASPSIQRNRSKVSNNSNIRIFSCMWRTGAVWFVGHVNSFTSLSVLSISFIINTFN